MKKILLLLIAIASLEMSGQAKDEREIQNAVIAYFDGITELDGPKIRKAVTTDFKLIEKGEIYNADTVISHISPLKIKTVERKNSVVFIETRQKGNTAWVSYHNTADITVNGKSRTIKWLESAILEKTKSMWKIAMMHSTLIQ